MMSMAPIVNMTAAAKTTHPIHVDGLYWSVDIALPPQCQGPAGAGPRPADECRTELKPMSASPSEASTFRPLSRISHMG